MTEPTLLENATADDLGEALLQSLDGSEPDRRLALELDRWLSQRLQQQLQQGKAEIA